MRTHAMHARRRCRWACKLAAVAVVLAGCAPPPRQAIAEGQQVSPEPPQSRQPIAVGAGGRWPLSSEPSSMALEISAPGRERFAALADGDTFESLRLVIEDIELLRPGATYEVYLEPPPGPDPTDPSFVGHLAVFGSVEETPPSSRSFDVGERLRALAAAGMEGAALRLLFLPGEKRETGAAESGPALRLGRVSIVSR